MQPRDFSLEALQNIDEDRLKKDAAYKQRIALEYLNLLIYLINEEAALEYQARTKSGNEAPETEDFEKNINHALTLLAAAIEGIKKDGPTDFSDYLISSALSYTAEYLPAASVSNIINKLDDITRIGTKQSQQPDTEKPSSTNRSDSSGDHAAKKTSAAEKQDKQPDSPSAEAARNTDKGFNDLISRASPILFTPEAHKATDRINHNKQVVIDFAADKIEFRAYGKKRSERLGASLIQVQPDQFSAVNAKFSISKNTTLTFIGHCSSGSNCLSDNSGKKIYASQLARQIHAKMVQSGTQLDTEFTIDLIACQAASGRDIYPSFAERLVTELAKLGINRVNVIASPTIMMTTHDGSQANLSISEDRKFSAQMEGREQHDTSSVSNKLTSSFNSIFSSRPDPTRLKVEKVTFRSDSNGHAIRVK